MLTAPRPLTKSVETQRHDKGPKMSCFHISSLASNQIDLGEECHGMDVSRAQGSHDEAHLAEYLSASCRVHTFRHEICSERGRIRQNAEPMFLWGVGTY